MLAESVSSLMGVQIEAERRDVLKLEGMRLSWVSVF